MEDVDLRYAKEHLEDLLARAASGEDVRIVDPLRGVIRLVLAQGTTQLPQKVILGQWKHLLEIPEERLLAPLTDEELADLSGENSSVE